MSDVNRGMTVRLLVGTVAMLILLILRWEFSFLLVHRGMPRWQVDMLIGKEDFADTLPGVPPEEGYGAFYDGGFFRPFLAVERGQDDRVRKIHYYYR